MPKATSKPAGYHSITPSIMFDDASEAIEFYKRAFGAQEVMRMPGPGGRIMHAEIKIGDSVIMLGDIIPGMPGRSARTLGGSPMGLHIYVENVEALFKRAIAAGASQTMPLADQFWGDRYGKVADPFGLEWGLAEHVKDVTEEEMKRAAQQYSQQMQQGMH
jgi:uncharacterized glyoxalase superfamily protein PhnB